MAANCDDRTDRNQAGELMGNGSTKVVIEVHCDATGIAIGATVDGIDLDRWLEIYLNDGLRLELARVNGVETVSRLAPGTYRVKLGAESNCRIEPESQSVVVTFRRVTPVHFTGTCVASTGAVMVRMRESGEDLDLSGYAAASGDHRLFRTIAGEVAIPDLLPGSHAVRISEVAPNCAVTGPNPANVLVTAGRTQRDTTLVEFAVTCARAWGMALVRGNRITLATEDGGTVDVLGPGGQPAWAPDGRTMAYACTRLCVVDLQAGRIDSSPPGMLIADVAWHPGGTTLLVTEQKCAYVDWYYYYQVYSCSFKALTLVTPSGEPVAVVPLPTGVVASDVAWSPDGSLIAFTCTTAPDTQSRICTMRPDGSGLRELTSGEGGDSAPAWSPDGRQIAFVTTRFTIPEITIMQADGTERKRLDPVASGSHPVWLPSGGEILYSSTRAGREGLTVVKVDGGMEKRLTTGAGDGQPALRPLR
jgi:hypothetical protein